MVAIKQASLLSTVPLLLAVASTVVGSHVSDDLDLVSRDELGNGDEFGLFETRDEAVYTLEARGKGDKPKVDKPKIDKTKISNPRLIGGTNPIAMSDKTLKPAGGRNSQASNTRPKDSRKWIKRNLRKRGKGDKPKIDKSRISNPRLISGTNPIVMNDKTLKASGGRNSKSSTRTSHGDPFYLEEDLKKLKKGGKKQ